MVLFKVALYFLYYILIARCWLLFIPYPITGLFDERWTFLLRESLYVGGGWVCLMETWTVVETILNTM
jgi:hypothetical protein